MKKTIFLFILTFIIFSGNTIFSQVLSGYCPQKEKTRELCMAGDSLARFMDNIKKTSSEDAWVKFTEDAALGPVAAFNNFGDRGDDLRATFTQLGNTLDQHTRSLISAVNPDRTLTGLQVRDAIVSQIQCYYKDTLENDLKKLVNDGGGPVPNRLDGGPCEIAARSCYAGAASTYSSQLISCGFGTGGIIKWLGGWWGAGAGFVCFVIANSNYNNAKWTCFENYCECIHCN